MVPIALFPSIAVALIVTISFMFALRPMNNVNFRNPVDRDELLKLYAQADVFFLHLNDYSAFRKVLPSKIFEYAATGKPVLAGVAGHARKFIAENVTNSAVFDPCDAKSMTSAVESLRFESVSRSDFNLRYSRKSIMSEMALDVLSILR